MLTDHAASRVEILPVTGLPEFRPGDDLTGAIATAARWLRSGDIVVVTSKVVSKVEGRLVRVPADPVERERIRRRLVFDESVRILARRGQTLITENQLGLVQAASGVDASNVAGDELALLPANPDATATALRRGLAERLGVEVAVVVTDTMGRAWRVGQTDVAIGSSGLAVLHGYAGQVDRQGNELAVTEIAIADEVAGAADLVKGKLGAVPVAVVRGLEIGSSDTAARLIRPVEEDLFRLGTEEALARGRREAALLYQPIRSFADRPVPESVLRDAVALMPPDTHVVHVGDPVLRKRLLDGLEADDVLYQAPELMLPFGDDAVAALRIALAAAGLGSCWVQPVDAGVVRAVLELPQSWSPLGVLAVGYPPAPPADPPADPDRFVSR